MKMRDINWESVWMMPPMLYKYYKNLSDIQKHLLSKSGLTQSQELTTCQISSYYDLSIKKSIKLVKKGEKLRQKTILTRTVKSHPFRHTPEIVIKELNFLGFIPLDEYKPYKKDSKFDFIITNNAVMGNRYIYPEKLSVNITIREKYGVRHTHEVFQGLTLEGFLRIEYSKLNK